METATATIATITVKEKDLNRIYEIVETIAMERDDLKVEVDRLKGLLIPKEIDMDKYNALDLSDIDLSKQTKSLCNSRQ